MQIIKNTIAITFMLIAIDTIFFIVWALSGQTPVDGFYLGAFTKTIISLFI